MNNSVSKAEFVDAVAKRAGLTKADAKKAVDSAIDLIQEEVAKGRKVQFVGFGSFVKRRRASRVGRNPQTGQSIEIPATEIPAFHAGQVFKDMVKKG